MPQHLLSLRPTYHPLSALTICVSSLFLSPNPTPPHPTTTSLRSPRRSSALAPPTPSMSRQLIEQYDFHPIPETARMEPASVFNMLGIVLRGYRRKSQPLELEAKSALYHKPLC
jgi:hypothetical protein